MSIVYFRFSRDAGGWQRSPLLERLIALSDGSVPVPDWRADAFHALAGASASMPAVGAAALCAEGCNADGWACVAAPVHLSAGMSNVVMPQRGILRLDRDELNALVADFNRIFAGSGMRLRTAGEAWLLCVFEEELDVATHDPENATGFDVYKFQPTGKDAARLRRAMSEMEMWLHEHEVNRRRSAAGVMTVTGLWLWGGGSLPGTLPDLNGWSAGDDLFFKSVGMREVREQGEVDRLGAGSGVVTCSSAPGASAWPEAEAAWLAPAAAAVRSGRITRLEISAGAYRFSVRRWSQMRLWRRSRPWWESFDVAEPVL